MSTKLVIRPEGGLPPAKTLITNFVLSSFSGLDMIYIYMIYVNMYMEPLQGPLLVAANGYVAADGYVRIHTYYINI